MILTSFFIKYLLPAIVLAVVGGVFGVLIAVLSKVFYVKEDDRIDKVLSLLPGYNCGACGNAGCRDMAKKIVEGEASSTLCKPIKTDKIEEIKRLLAESSKEN